MSFSFLRIILISMILMPVSVHSQELSISGNRFLMDKNLAMYETVSRINTSSDQFTVEMRAGNTTYEKTFEVQVTNRVGYPISEQGAVYDGGGIINPGESLVVDVLANDAEGASGLEIEVAPNKGIASVTYDQKITYTADSEYI